MPAKDRYRRPVHPPEFWSRPEDRIDSVNRGGVQVPRCQAQQKRTKPPKRCGRAATRGKRVCHQHGGANPGGPLKHGRYSMRLGPLNEAYRQIMEEGDLNRFEPGLAALDAWVEFQAQLAERGDGLEFRQQAVELFDQLETAMRSGDTVAVSGFLQQLKAHLRDGQAKVRALARAMDTVSRRQHHTERAREIEQRGDQVIQAKALLAFLARVVEIVRQELPKDAPRVLKRLTDEVLASGRWLGVPTDRELALGNAVR